MDTRTLVLALAGTVPFYDPREYLFPSRHFEIKRLVMDYRSTSYNNPIGKGAHFLLQGLKAYSLMGQAKVVLKMWGSVDPAYSSQRLDLNLQDMVEISGFIPKKESLQKLASCDVQVLTLSLGVDEFPPFPLPGKMFDYFHVGKPILALVEESYCAEVLRESGLALIVDPKSPEKVASAIKWMADQKEQLGNHFQLKKGFLERFGREAMVDTMAQLFDEVLS
ncbi:MAG: glycosyltransferase [Bacteroidetes bacterium]|nr:glycosyltransferase [Bacteroidota bacterium]